LVGEEKMLTIINRLDKFVVKRADQDFHSKHGFIRKDDLKNNKAVTNTGVEFSLFESPFIDMYDRKKRMAQIITQKDIGTIICETGLGKDSTVLEAGSGSGALCCFLANICKKIISYEIREDHLAVAKENAQMLGMENITFKMADVRDKIAEKNVDVVVLDMPDPWNALANASKALKLGGFLVVYSPTIPQVMDTVAAVNSSHKDTLQHISTFETIQRPWEIDERKVRPFSSYINHTAFLTFIRKV